MEDKKGETSPRRKRDREKVFQESKVTLRWPITNTNSKSRKETVGTLDMEELKKMKT